MKKYLSIRSESAFLNWLDKFYGDLPDHIRRAMGPVLRSYAEAIQASAAGEVGTKPGMTDELERFIEDYLAAYTTRHVSSSLGQLRMLVRNSPPERMADMIETRVDERAEARPDKISTREIVQMGSAVAAKVFFAAGAAIVWLAQGADPCPYCQALDGVTVGRDGAFVAKGQDFEPAGADGSM